MRSFMTTSLERLCNFITENDYPRMDDWQWGQGVCIYALEKAYQKNGNEKYLDYIEHWIESHLSQQKPGFSVNTTSPLHGILALNKYRNQSKYMYLCDEFAQYLMAENPRCDRGAFEHTCVANNIPNQIWIDTVFMGCIFLARYGVLTQNRMYVNEALRQLVLHYDYLHKEDNKLLCHGYYCDDRTQHGAVWGRGNAWYSAASAEILEMTDESYPLYNEAKKRFITHCEAVIKYQRDNGSFGTIIIDPTSYSETTGTSGMAYGITKAVNMGFIDNNAESNYKAAYRYLESCIGENGAMLEGSDGTCVNDDMNLYRNTRKADSEFCQGLAILAFSI